MMLKYYIDNANDEDLKEKLENDYPQIYSAMCEENYEMEYPTYGFISEIKHEDEVVGIIVLQKIKEITLKYALSEFYIIPEYRSDELFLKYFFELVSIPNMELYIRKPSKKLVETMIKFNYALRVTSNIVISPIPFICSIDEVYNNRKLKNYYNKIYDKNDEYLHVSNYYNLTYSSVLISNTPLYFPHGNDDIMIVKPQKNDLNGYLRKKLAKITPSNLKKMAELIYDFNGLQTEVQKNHNLILERLLSVENIIGTSTKLTDDITSFLNDNDISIEEGFKIRQEVQNALDEQEIDNKNIFQRFKYIVTHNTFEPANLELSLKCPHCNNPIDYFSISCINCGHDLKHDLLFRSIEEIANRELDGFDFQNLGDDELFVNAIFTKKLIDRIEDNNYEGEDVLNAQALYGSYVQIKSLKEDSCLSEGYDLIIKLKEGCSLIYAVNHEYIEKLTRESFINLVKNEYSIEDVENELKIFDIPYVDGDKESLINQMIDYEYFEVLYDDRFIPTEKGLELLSCDLLNYYDKYISKKYLFYEFKKLWDENIDTLSPDEIKNEFLKNAEPM